MELKCMNDLFKYLESKFDRKITEAEKRTNKAANGDSWKVS